MSLPNQVVYIQFHPVAYMVKLNIEMSMANLITKLASQSVSDRVRNDLESSSHHHHTVDSQMGTKLDDMKSQTHKPGVHTFASGKRNTADPRIHSDFHGIHQTKEVHMQVDEINYERDSSSSEDFKRGQTGQFPFPKDDDETPLTPFPLQGRERGMSRGAN